MKFISLKKFVIISRPILFPLIFLCLLVAFYFSFRSLIFLNKIDFIFILLLTFLIPFFTFSINDLEDYYSDKQNHRKRNIIFGKFHLDLLSFRRSINLYNFLIFLILFIYSLTFHNIQTTVILVIFLFLLYFYSAKPIRFKERFILDCLSNGFISLFSFALIYSLKYSVFSLPLSIYLISLAISSYHLIAAQLDYSPDKSANQKTSVIVINNKHVVFSFSIFLNLPLFLVHFNSFFKYLVYLNLIIILIFWIYPKINKKIVFFIFFFFWIIISVLYFI
ncbi:MAG: UbiA family prenyltransferase [Novosphingobium sp.]|nr:UbiA family prenyltransferase [Novosphingobium sp.]